jgi:predicted CXXCH cytochrome family protein
MNPPATGRHHTSRIPLDYFKTPGLWERRRAVLTIVAAVAAAAWWTAGILLGRQNASFHSPGKLASVHKMWESQCAACHVDFRPIRADAAAALHAGGTIECDAKCQACHRGAEHHPVRATSEVPGCTTCHQEHQGAEASLVRVDDRLCTCCHQSIAGHAAGTSAIRDVSRFDAQHHPDFVSDKKERLHLKFSHARHMTPGQVANPGNDNNVFTLKRLSEMSDAAQRERYRHQGQSDDAPVRLDCNSCHQLDGGDFPLPPHGTVAAMLPVRPAGSYMLPTTYENHCQACHPLYKAPGVVQHGQTPDEIHKALQREFARQSLLGSPALLGQYLPSDPLPSARSSRNETVSQAIDRNVATAEGELRQEYCGKCHEFASSAPGLQPVIPPRMPQVWYQRANFDHRAHRAMDCLECHANARPQTAKGHAVTTDQPEASLLPDRGVCLKCHSPPSPAGLGFVGGARYDCVECHRYHNGAAPLAGSGAKAESPERKLKQEEFESGETR